LSNYYTKSETSGATEIASAFGLKVDKTSFDDKLGSGFTGANSGNTVTKVIEDNELVVSTALNNLNNNKLDASAYTPTDLSNYYTKSETSGATEIATAFNEKANTGHTHDASGVTAMTGYQVAANSASVLTTDSLLEAIGKLEKRIQLLEAAMGGITIVKISQADYDNLSEKDSNTLYVIV
jgi:hypothetical protein